MNWWPFWSPVTAAAFPGRRSRVCVVRRLAGVHADVRAREQRAETRSRRLPPMRGRTTQKRVSLTAKSAASLVSCTCTSTCEWSCDSVIVFTAPTSTSL